MCPCFKSLTDADRGSWYSASEEFQREQPTTKRKRGRELAPETSTAAAIDNPYAGPVAKRFSRKSQRAESPAYAPPSLSHSEDRDRPDDRDEEAQNEDGNEEEVVDWDGFIDETGDTTSGYAVPESNQNHNLAGFSTLSSTSASAATYEDAIAYAMSAQYAAGYWLGVAHSKSVSASVTKVPTTPPQTRIARRRDRPEPSTNVIRTRQEFPATQTTRIRR